MRTYLCHRNGGSGRKKDRKMVKCWLCFFVRIGDQDDLLGRWKGMTKTWFKMGQHLRARPTFDWLIGTVRNFRMKRKILSAQSRGWKRWGLVLFGYFCFLRRPSPQSLDLHVLTQLSDVSISSCADCAACPATTIFASVSRISDTDITGTTDPWNLWWLHNHGVKSECLFRVPRVQRTLTKTDQDTVCKTECVRTDESDRRLQLKRRLVRLDYVGHVLLRRNLHVPGHRRFHQMRHARSHVLCKFGTS